MFRLCIRDEVELEFEEGQGKVAPENRRGGRVALA
jgi:hypothetical protein